MTIWRSPHPDLDIPTDVTTYQHFFESPITPLSGAYENATTKERLTFQEVKHKAELLSTIFIQCYGLRPGDTVSLFSGNSVWYPVGVWATVRAGGRVNGASPAYTIDETIHALRTAQTKILLTLPSSLAIASAAARRVGIPPSHVLLLEGSHPDVQSIQTLINNAVAEGIDIIPTWRIPRGVSNTEVCGYLNFSSGTTGLPKAVMLSHHNIIAQCYQLRQLQVLSPARAASNTYPHGLPPYRILAVMPLFHITGLVRFVSYPVFMAGLSVMLPTFTLQSMIEAILEYEIEELILVPPIIIRLVQDTAVVDPYLAELRRVVKRWSSGSAPIAPEIVRALQRKFPDTGFRQGYGATESTACISAHPPSHFDYRYAHTGGLLVANTIAKVVALAPPTMDKEEAGEEEVLLGPGEIGEICARGPQIAMGYLGNERATAETFDKDGFLHTGDVGCIDAEGLIVISDRIKEMIKVKGQQVAPAELEDLLLGRPEVDDVAVIGVADVYAGERPKAFVVLKDRKAEGEKVARELMRFVREKTVRYKWIKEIEFVESVPKSATGKLLRRILKAWERGEDKDRQKGLMVKDDTERSKL